MKNANVSSCDSFKIIPKKRRTLFKTLTTKPLCEEEISPLNPEKTRIIAVSKTKIDI
jgi:hypothetical protein